MAPCLLLQDPLPNQQEFTFSDNVNLVLLDASVRDPHDGYVPGLQKENFRVTDDGKPQVITQFNSIDAPVTLGLVVDNSGSMRTKRDEVLQAGLAFARESNAKDEFFVVNFNNTVVPGLPPQTPFTDSLPMLQRALYYGRVGGQTALYDAISYSLRHLERGHHEQRTLIVVSDGGDNVSKTSRADLLDQIESSRATIYTIGLADPENRDLNPAVLRKFAAITGGEYFQPKNLDAVLPIFERISKDIRSRYTIGFVPGEMPGHGADKRAVRTIKVSASRDGRRLVVRARTTYRMPVRAAKV
jgi:Ca-activated chloride channel family protein